MGGEASDRMMIETAHGTRACKDCLDHGALVRLKAQNILSRDPFSPEILRHTQRGNGDGMVVISACRGLLCVPGTAASAFHD